MAHPTVQQLCTFLDSFAPPQLAEEWDNTGLLVGDRNDEVTRLMTCLTVTPDSTAEAIERQANMIVTHHPLPFRPIKRITTDTVPGALLWQLIRAGVAIYSPHTSFDSAAMGINQALADGLEVVDAQPLQPSIESEEVGSGRYGSLAPTTTLGDVATRLKQFLNVERLKVVGELNASATKLAVACGSAGQFLGAARAKGCDVLVTGETNFHTCLEAEATGVGLLLPGHYPSERFAVERLASALSADFQEVICWASEREHDPVTWI